MTSIQPAVRGQRERTSLTPAKLFIGGLSRNTTTKHLRDHFARYGRILDCVAMRQPDGRPRGFGYVTLDSPAAADRCLAEPQYVDGRQLDMKRAVPEGAGEMPTARLHPGKGKATNSTPPPVSMADFDLGYGWPRALPADCLDLLTTSANAAPLSGSLFPSQENEGKSRPTLGNITNVINRQDAAKDAKPLKAGPVHTSPALDAENAFGRAERKSTKKGLQVMDEEYLLRGLLSTTPQPATKAKVPGLSANAPVFVPSQENKGKPPRPALGNITNVLNLAKDAKPLKAGPLHTAPLDFFPRHGDEAWVDSSDDENLYFRLPPPGLAPPPGLTLQFPEESSAPGLSALLSTTPQLLSPMEILGRFLPSEVSWHNPPASPTATAKNTATIATQTADGAEPEISREDLLRLRSAGGEAGLKAMVLP
eukprot:CAMPEP_0181426576 /NCGR_PEP_ID=MMETSP1110-20121109/15733_1 /TAXON_ID=174948 /ORGANISM="Symbiodinium sp., Strain CCMP421" /LENGTH=422 /DNA_ID=CAMNT_0023549773 /DNA_START=86 /DNA_END=1354 /DNA_ORIENTATION=-